MDRHSFGERQRPGKALPAASRRQPPVEELSLLVQRWLHLLSSSGRAAPATVRAYGTDLQQFLDHLAEAGHSMRPDDVKASDVAGFRDGDGAWKPSTVRRKLAAVSRFFHWVVERGHVEVNPAVSVSRPKSRDEHVNFVTPEDALAMLLECRDDRERGIFMAFWSGGLRYQEVQSLRLDDVDLHRSEMTVKGKGAHVARMPILADFRPYLVRWLEVRPDVEHPFLFTSRTGAPMYDQCARRLLTRLTKDAGLAHKGYRPHDLRHGRATQLYEEGVDVGTIARFLRHRDLTCVNRYIHASTTRTREEIEGRLGRHDAGALGALRSRDRTYRRPGGAEASPRPTSWQQRRQGEMTMKQTSNVKHSQDELTPEERIARIGELLVLGAIAAVGLSEGGKDRGCEGGGCDESKEPEKARSP